MKTARIISILLIIISVLTVITAISAKIFERRFGPIVLKNINNQLNTEINVEKISFSVIKKFPNASFELTDALIKPSQEFLKSNNSKSISIDTLLFARNLFLEFNVIDLLKKRYNIKSVEVKNGLINIFINRNGIENYLIWNEKEEKQNEIELNLNNLTIKNISVYYVNQLKLYEANTSINQLNIKGLFSGDITSLNTHGTAIIDNLKFNNVEYNIKRNVSLILNMAKNKLEYTFTKSNISISGMQFNLNGSYTNTDKPVCDININANNTELNSLIHLLPKVYIKKFKDYSAFGSFSFKTTITGAISKYINPKIDIDFSLKEGSFINNKTDMLLSDLSLKGNFSNGRKKSLESSSLNLRDFKFSIDSSMFSGNYSITNFQHPILKINSTINVELAQIQDFFELDTIKNVKGKLKSTFWFSGKFNDIQNPGLEELKSIKLSGETFIENASIQLEGNQHQYSKINAKVIFADNDLKISKLKFADNENSFSLEGLILNYFPYFFFEGEELFIDAKVKSNYLDLEHYISESTETGESEVNLPGNLNFSIGLDIKNFVYSKFKANKLKCLIHYKDRQLEADEISFKTMSGQAEGNGILYQDTAKNINIKLQSNLNNIRIEQLFYSFNNFSQEFLKSDNLKGNISGDIKFSGKWNDKLEIVTDQIFSEGTFSITNGELIDFEPMQSLSKYASVEELKHIKFSELRNTIYISNQKVIIPDMQISSTAFNIGISGEHTFANEIDYHMNILLSEVLSKRFKRKKKHVDEEFENIEDDGLGRTMIHLSIIGNVNDYDIDYDRKKVRKKIREDFEIERQEVKKIVKDEFKIGKKNTRERKFKGDEDEETTKMIFEFESDTLNN